MLARPLFFFFFKQKNKCMKKQKHISTYETKKIKNTKKKMVEVGSFKYCDNKETLHIHLNRVQISVFVSINTQPKYGRSKQNKKST